MATETVETAIYKLRVEGQAEIDRLTKSVAGLAVAEEKATSSTRTFSDTLQKQVARIDPLVRAQEQYRKALEVNARYRESGAGTETQLNAQLSAATQNYQRQVQAIQAVEKASVGHANATKLQRHELVNLGRQGADVFTQLASGQSLFLIAAQQGPQVLDVLATSQAKVGDVFKSAVGWAGRFLASTAGIVTGIGAIAVGAIYMATQFSRASTTIEEALEKQNSLLKEGTALLDARTSAEARAQAASKEQTQFETLQNQIDLQIKLNKAMEDAAKIAQRRATTPTEVPGEMGVAPTAFAALSDPGMDKMTAAFVALKEAQAAGLPGLKQYNAELAKIGMEHPELALIVQDMIKLGEAGLKLENAAQRATAMADALAGVATNAQMAAVGLGSIAQFQANNLLAEQAAAAKEREAVATLKIAALYPGMTIETAKQLQAMQNALPVAEAWTNAARMRAQEQATYNNLLDKGLSAEEASAVAAKEYQLSKAAAAASARQLVQASQDNLDKIKAMGTGMEGAVDAAIAYRDAIDAGATATQAAAIAANTLEASMIRAAQAAQQVEQAMIEAQNVAAAGGSYVNGIYQMPAQVSSASTGGQPSNFNVDGRQHTSTSALGMSILKSHEMAVMGAAGTPTSLSGGVDQILSRGGDLNAALSYVMGQQAGAAEYAQSYTGSGRMGVNFSAYGLSDVMTNPGASESEIISQVNSLYNLLNAQTSNTSEQIANLESELAWLQSRPASLEQLNAISQLKQSIESLIDSTDDLTASNNELLSPYYSQDPRKSHIGYRTQGMANEGSFIVPGGYSSNDNTLVTMPLASGEQVDVSRPGSRKSDKSTVINITNNIVVGPGVNKDEFGKTAYQQTQAAARQIAGTRQ